MLPPVRDAVAADNAALVEIAAACPMEGDIGLCIDRGPDFLALNRLEGVEHRLGVVDGPDGKVVGCVAVSLRTAYVNGEPQSVTYVGDMKVHPDHREPGVAVALAQWAQQASAQYGDNLPALSTVLAGNSAMEVLFGERRRLARLHPVATVRSYSVPVLWKRKEPAGQLLVRQATVADLDSMTALWSTIAPLRQFNRAFTGPELNNYIEAAPGLSVKDYLVAHRPDGTLAGFLAVWDQRSFKQTRVTSYSRSLNAFRRAFNLVAPHVGGAALPEPGGHMNTRNVAHICVLPTDVDVLRALLLRAHNSLRHSGCSFFSVGLDRTDPLGPALDGLLAQTTDVTAALGVAPGKTPIDLDGRPVQHEIALV